MIARVTLQSTPQERFIEQIAAIRRQLDALPAEAVRALTEEVDRVRRQVLAEIAAGPEGFPEYRLRDLARRLADVLGQFAARYETVLGPIQAQMYTAGAELAARPLVDAGVTYAVPQITRRQLEVLQGYQASLISGVAEDTVRAITSTLRLGALRGESVPEILTRVAGRLDDPGPFGTLATRAEAITRTELGRAQAIATQAGLDETRRFVPDLKKQWQHSGNRGPYRRLGHVEAHGQTRDVDAPFRVRPAPGHRYENLMFPRDAAASPENSVFCFLPGTLVSGRFVGALKARYAGPAREIKTARGQRLRVTPNHPVLTSDGWLPAGEIQEGQALLGYRGHENGSFLGLGDVDAQDRPASIEDVFQALSVQSAPLPAPYAMLNLHGDQVWTYGDVQVTGSYRELLLYRDARAAEERSEFVLMTEPSMLSGVHALSPQRLGRQAISLAGSGRVGVGVLTSRPVGLGPKPGPHEMSSVGTSSELDAALGEVARQRAAGYPGVTAQLEERYPGLVEADQVVKVRDIEHRGHVYDLQSPMGVLVADGIIASNCGCISVPWREEWAGDLGRAA
jgi:hypothetical protein